MEPKEWASLDYFKDYYWESEQTILSTLPAVAPTDCELSDINPFPLVVEEKTAKWLW